jgi:hypothetical protein
MCPSLPHQKNKSKNKNKQTNKKTQKKKERKKSDTCFVIASLESIFYLFIS